MPSNVTLNSGTGGAAAVTKQVTHDGDTAQLQGVFVMGISGTEDSYTVSAINGEATNGLDVDVTRVIPGTSATHLGKAEDAAHTSGDVGVMALTVRQDAAAALGGVDGDYQPPITDASGRLWVNASGAAVPVTDNGSTLSIDDGAGSLTVDNAALAVTGGGAEATALRVTLASDSTGVVSIDDNGTTLSVDDGGGSLTVDGTVAVSGTVTVGSHAVTNAGTFATQVDGAALTALQLIDNIVLAEDAAHASGDAGVMALAVRRDADTSLVGADGDYAPLQVNAAGSLKVAITAGAGSGGTSIADGASFTRNTTSITPAGAVVETSAPTLTNGDAAGLSMTTGGALRVSIASGGVAGLAEDAAAAGGEEGVMVLAVRRDAASSGVSADGDFAALSVDANGALRVTGGGGGTQYAEDAAHVSGDTGTMALAVRQSSPANLSGANGDYEPLQVNAGRLWVSATIDAALPAGTANIGDVDVLTLPNVTLAAGTNTNEVVGDAAHDAAIAGNPVRIAGRGMSADYAAVATGDTADILASLLGKQINLPYALPANTWNYAAASGGITNTTAVTIRAAQAAGIRNYVTSIQVINAHATVSTEVLIRDGAVGTVLHRGWAQAVGGGFACKFDSPLRGTAATLLEVVNVTTGAAVYVNAQGFSAAE